MGSLKSVTTFLLVTSVFFGVISTIVFILLIETHPVPQVEDEYWGSKYNKQSDLAKESAGAIYKFKVDVSPNEINELKSILKRELLTSKSRLPPPLEGVGFEYGFNTEFLQRVGEYWLNEYNWPERQKLLNKYPHFKTKIGGLDIHFQHVKPIGKSKETRPILIIHGWPGSFVEFQKLIPLLLEPQSSKYNYELIIPSLPGYGFSSTAARPGMSCTEMANIFKRLMMRLGHDKFYVMGGDWGSEITTDLATLYPNNVIAAQSNLCHTTTVISYVKYFLATAFPELFRTERDYGHSKIISLPELFSFAIRETGYFHIQSSKPDTIGVALTHSPLGLASYILEKFSGATNRSWINRNDGGLLEKFSFDELLDNVMIYWVTGTALSAARLYKEQMNPYKKHKMDRVPTSVPFSCQYMPEEIMVIPEYALQNKYYNIQSYTIESKGGHFGAWEEPELVAQNVISHFDKF